MTEDCDHAAEFLRRRRAKIIDSLIPENEHEIREYRAYIDEAEKRLAELRGMLESIDGALRKLG